MAVKMVREPSETPNINNIDDIVPMRYAYGNQNGYVIGKGNEISNTVNGLNFTVNSGRLVLQGVECDIDAVGVTITIDNIATTRYYVVYLQVNLGTNTVSILSTYDTATYPTIDSGDDLTENTTGIARLPLYRFIATSGVISEVNKVVESIKYIKDVKVNYAKKSDNSVNSENTKKVNNVEITNDLRQYEFLVEANSLSVGSKINFNKTVKEGDLLLIERGLSQIYIKLVADPFTPNRFNDVFLYPVTSSIYGSSTDFIRFGMIKLSIYSDGVEHVHSFYKAYGLENNLTYRESQDNVPTAFKIYRII